MDISHFVGASLALASAGTVQVQVIDPVLQTQAYTYTVPAGWKFEGAVVAGSPCLTTASPVFRVTGPDGITELKALPRFDWTWWDQQPPPPEQPGDCPAFDREITVADLLKAMTHILGVTVVREEPLPNHAEMQEKGRSLYERHGIKSDDGRFVVQYTVKGVAVEEDLIVKTMCMNSTHYTSQGKTPYRICNARVTRGRTRQGELAAARETFSAIEKSIVIDREWSEKSFSLMARRTANDRPAAAVRAEAEAQAVRRRQEEQLIAALRGGKTGPAGEDWADFALAQQKRR